MPARINFNIPPPSAAQSARDRRNAAAPALHVLDRIMPAACAPAAASRPASPADKYRFAIRRCRRIPPVPVRAARRDAASPAARQAAKIRKPRLETQKPHHILHRRVQFDHLLFAQPAMARDVAKIWSRLAAVDNRDTYLTGFRLQRIALFPPALQLVNRLPRHLLRTTQHNGDVVHPRDHFNHLFAIGQPLRQAPDTFLALGVTGGSSSETTAVSPNR